MWADHRLSLYNESFTGLLSACLHHRLLWTTTPRKRKACAMRIVIDQIACSTASVAAEGSRARWERREAMTAGKREERGLFRAWVMARTTSETAHERAFLLLWFSVAGNQRLISRLFFWLLSSYLLVCCFGQPGLGWLAEAARWPDLDRVYKRSTCAKN